MKTMTQWKESKQDFSHFASLGDEIDEDLYFYFLEVLPPARMTAYGFLVGEPYDHDDHGKPVYAAFYEVLGRYTYGGHKTVQEFMSYNH